MGQDKDQRATAGPTRRDSARRRAAGLARGGIVIGALWVAVASPAMGQASIEYTPSGHFLSTTGVGGFPTKSGAFGLAPAQSDGLSVVLSVEHSITRRPDPTHPGFDLVETVHDHTFTISSVAAGVAFPFTQTLTVSVPVLTIGPVGAWQATSGTPFGSAAGHLYDCTQQSPCGVSRGAIGPRYLVLAPLPIEFDVTDTLTTAGNGAGAPGDSVIDVTNTATLSLQLPAGVTFTLASGTLADDPAALPLVSGVPEPATATAMLWMAGLAGAGLLRRRGRGEPGSRGRSSTPASGGAGHSWVGAGIALLVPIAVAAWPGPARAFNIGTNYFAYDHGAWRGGDAKSSTTLTQLALDSGPMQTGSWDWQARSEVDLASGTLRVFDSSDTRGSGLPSSDAPALNDGWRSQSRANLSDSVTIFGPGGARITAPVTVTIGLHVDGSFAGHYAAMSETALLRADLGTSQVRYDWAGDRPVGSAAPLATVVTSGTVTGISADPAGLQTLLSVTTTVSPSFPTVLIFGQLDSYAEAGDSGIGAVDFAHTARLSIELPQDYSYVSGSGVLLTAAVPEPTTALLLAAGLLVVGRRASRAVSRPATRDATDPQV